MPTKGPTWDEHQKVLQEKQKFEQEAEELRQKIEDVTTLNKTLAANDQLSHARYGVQISDSKFVNALGKYMVPQEDTLENHYRLIFHRENELDFWPEQSPAFDGLVSQTFLDPAFSRSNHPRYFDLESLRDNTAIVRNHLMHVVLNGVDVSDPKQLETAQRKLEQMGREIGVALQRDTLFKRPGSTSLSAHEASEPGVGAAKIYELLLKKQEKNKTLHWLKKLFKFDYGDWNLPAIEQTPFSKANVEAFCLGEFATQGSLRNNDPETAETPAPEPPPLVEEQAQAPAIDPVQLAAQQFRIAQLREFGAKIAGAAYSLERVHRLPEPTKKEAVDLARDILEKMRMNQANPTGNQWMSRPAEEVINETAALSSIAGIYADSYQSAIAADPLLKDSTVLQQCNEALGKLSYMFKQQAGMALAELGQTNDALAIMSELETLPPNWRPGANETVADLLMQMQLGLEMTFETTQKAQQKQLGNILVNAQVQRAGATANVNQTPQQIAAQLQQFQVQKAQTATQNPANQLPPGQAAAAPLATIRNAHEAAAKMPVEPEKNGSFVQNLNAKRNAPAQRNGTNPAQNGAQDMGKR